MLRLNKVQRLTWLGRVAAGLLAAIVLSSCGGFFPAADAIVSISLSPTSAFILPSGTQQFTATATLGNNTNSNVTSQVTWLSSSPNVATVNASGLVTGVALGTTTITAKSNNSSVTATAPVTVSSKTITAITITPANATISISSGQTQQFTATATFSDGSFGDVTTTASWTSGSVSVATISSTGLATPVSVGSTTIGASAGGVAGTTTLTVTE